MERWKLTIDISEVWKKAEARDIEVNDFTIELYQRLSNYTRQINTISFDMVDDFNSLMTELHTNDFQSYDDFDEWMAQFHNWADFYRAWIKTKF
jgi:hypothetical protein